MRRILRGGRGRESFFRYRSLLPFSIEKPDDQAMDKIETQHIRYISPVKRCKNYFELVRQSLTLHEEGCEVS